MRAVLEFQAAQAVVEHLYLAAVVVQAAQERQVKAIMAQAVIHFLMAVAAVAVQVAQVAVELEELVSLHLLLVLPLQEQ